jgi:4-carboxymuconolactone decarboxylase
MRLMVVLMLLSSVPMRAQDRMPPIPTEKMTEAQKKAAAEYSAARKSAPGGPFAVLLRVPELMELALRWRQHVQFRSALDQRQTEFVILMTARYWTQQYEWNAHHQAAVKAGLKPEIVAAIADGRRPEQMSEDEAILYDLCTELQQNHGVSNATYARALSTLGEPAIVETASIAGYYTLLAMVMNTARTPLPRDAKPPLAPFPY